MLRYFSWSARVLGHLSSAYLLLVSVSSVVTFFLGVPPTVPHKGLDLVPVNSYSYRHRCSLLPWPRRAMKYFALALLLVLASGCRRTPVEANNTLGVVLTTDKRIYAPQDGITLQVENQTSDPILVRDCTEMEQRQEQRWEFVGHLGGCQGTFNSVGVGNWSRWGRTSLGVAYPAGEYRVAVMVLLEEDWEQQERAVSEAFTITR